MFAEGTDRFAVVQSRKAPELSHGRDRQNDEQNIEQQSFHENHSLTRIQTSGGQKASVFTFFKEAKASGRWSVWQTPTAL